MNETKFQDMRALYEILIQSSTEYEKPPELRALSYISLLSLMEDLADERSLKGLAKVLGEERNEIINRLKLEYDHKTKNSPDGVGSLHPVRSI